MGRMETKKEILMARGKVKPGRELEAQYEESVYAGVLGKVIGVYLGRPF